MFLFPYACQTSCGHNKRGTSCRTGLKKTCEKYTTIKIFTPDVTGVEAVGFNMYHNKKVLFGTSVYQTSTKMNFLGTKLYILKGYSCSDIWGL